MRVARDAAAAAARDAALADAAAALAAVPARAPAPTAPARPPAADDDDFPDVIDSTTPARRVEINRMWGQVALDRATLDAHDDVCPVCRGDVVTSATQTRRPSAGLALTQGRSHVGTSCTGTASSLRPRLRTHARCAGHPSRRMWRWRMA